jgi:5-methyltetrahydropteroyltriglutamate--homocysteine methyltransferase
MVLATNLGFPRIGVRRELKKATEAYWKGEILQSELLATAKDIRLTHWKMQKDAGIAHIPSNDFSFYDQMLDMSCLLGVVPERYKWDGSAINLDTYFAMARGNKDAPAMEMTKWFDTNYHYIVPELVENQKFLLSTSKVFDEFNEAKAAGILTRPVLVGPITFLHQAKKKGEWSRTTLLPGLIAAYTQILQKLQQSGAEWVQLDEPYLVLDLENKCREAYKQAYAELAQAAPGLKILVTTYFGDLGKNLDLATGLPVAALHIDLKRGEGQLDAVLAKMTGDKILSVGVVDGRNIWRNNLAKSLESVNQAVAKLGSERVWVAPSCSMLHSPIDLDQETQMDQQLKSWLAFGKQKLAEIATITKGANGGDISAELKASDVVAKDRATSPRIHNPDVQARMKSLSASMYERKSKFPERQKVQRAALNLPSFPTTTIGSFPQTKEIREARAAFKKGRLDAVAYDEAMKREIEQAVRFQEETGIDVLVHGEPERNDMVEYFGEQMAGYTFSQNGWVQSYGSRYVKPPIIFGDVSRPKPMTVAWSAYAQSLTNRPMKGMLTGPITMLFWSFVRDDQPKADTCTQIGLALRDEVVGLQNAGIKVIQIDEPAIREGLPLRRADWAEYLKWAVNAFRISAAGVEDTTQIHTHMCYSEFNDIIDSIAALDADSISIETSRSQMELLEAFVNYKYPNEIGPGVYDIHSPRIPSVAEMVELLEKAAKVIDPDLLWVNPDCGLKTRGWAEVKPALQNMVQAAKDVRARIKTSQAA